MDNIKTGIETDKETEQKPVIAKDEEGVVAKTHHRMKPIDDNKGGLFKVRNILNWVFIILAVIGIIIYLFGSTKAKDIAIIIMLVGVVIKFIEASLRIFHK